MATTVPDLPEGDKLSDVLLKGEQQTELSDADKKKIEEADQIRTTLASVYTFVRSQEINRSLSSKTLDHLIKEAMDAIKGDGRSVRDAAGQVIDTRPPKLDVLEKLKTDFEAAFAQYQELAKKADQEAGTSTGSTP